MSLAETFSGSTNRAAMPVRQQWLIWCLIAFMAMVMLNPYMTFAKLISEGEGNSTRQAIYLALLGVIVFAIRPLSDPRRLLSIPMPIVAALAWCVISLAWAIDPAVGARRLILTAVVIWSVFTMVRNLTVEQILAILRVSLVVVLVANWIAVLLFPEFGIHQRNLIEDKQLLGDWRGVMMHKNIAGAACAITILAFAFDAKRVYWPIRFVIIAAAGVFLFYSQSKTSGAMALGALLVGFLLDRYKSPYRALAIVAIFILFVGISLVLFIYKDPLHGNLTDPKAFTGRMQIWTALSTYASDHWFTGAGFGSFWDIGGNSPILHYAKGWVLTLSTGHCGYLDLLVTIGIVGLVLVFFAMIVWPSFRLLTVPIDAADGGAMPFSILFFCAGQNMTETSIFDRDALVNVFMLFSVAIIERIASRQRTNRNQSILMQRQRPRNHSIFGGQEQAR